MKHRPKKYKPKLEKVFTKDQVRYFYLYCSVILKDSNKVLEILESSFDRWKLIPREFLKRPEVYFYQLIRKRCYLELGENHKGNEENTTNLFDISISGIDGIKVKDQKKFNEQFWSLQTLSREILFFWAVLEIDLEEMSRLIGRKRVDLLEQLIDIKGKLQNAE